MKVHAPISLPMYEESDQKFVLYDGLHFNKIGKKYTFLENDENNKKTLDKIFSWNYK